MPAKFVCNPSVPTTIAVALGQSIILYVNSGSTLVVESVTGLTAVSRTLSAPQVTTLGPYSATASIVVTPAGSSSVAYAYTVDATNPNLNLTTPTQTLSDGTVVDLNGNPLPATSVSQAAIREPAVGLWWNFDASKQQNPLSDRSAFLTLTNTTGTALPVNGSYTAAAASVLTVASPCVMTLNSPIVSGAQVVLNTTGALPTGLVAGQAYYALTISNNGLSTTLAATPGGAAINTSGSQSGNHTVTYTPTPTVPLVSFNGSGVLQTDPSNFLWMQKSIFNTNTLGANDAIVIWFDITHGTTMGGTYTLFYWGYSAAEGWGMQLFGGAGLVKTKIRWDPIGGSGAGTGSLPLDANFSLCGDNALNTRSVVALQITRMTATGADPGVSGQGGGLFEVQMAKAGLTDQGPFGQHNFQVWQVPCLPGGVVASPRYASGAGLTIGGRCSANWTTLTEIMPTAPAGGGVSALGINFFGAQRRKRQQGLVSQIVRQYAAQYNAQGPTSTGAFLQPACVAI